MSMRPDSIPQLRPGCRFSEGADQGTVLLIPEGVLQLEGPGRKILELCDGRRTLEQIVESLCALFPGAPPERIASDTAAYLERLHDRQVIEY